MIIETGASSKLCATFQKNDPVALMGPTGIRGKLSQQNETILIAGTQLSLAMLCSYGQAMRLAGNKVIYLGFFKNKTEVYCQDDIEKIADVIIWVTETGDLIKARRPSDYSVRGDYLDALVHYAHGRLDSEKSRPEIPLADIDRIYLVGSSRFLRHFQENRKTKLKDFFVKNPSVAGSVYSTMQCMLKGVCAQCLQWQIDPETGARTKAVFACSWPEQPLELIDFDNIDERQIQNRLQEKLSSLWVDYLFEHFAIERV